MSAPPLVNQPSAWPTRKIGAAGLGGAVATVIIWALDAVGIVLAPEEAAALATLLSVALGYFTRERRVTRERIRAAR